MMKETGIIFSTALIPQVLDGTKTVTRRLWGLKEINLTSQRLGLLGDGATWWFESDKFTKYIKCPYGGPGDMLYVKETYEWVTLGEKDPWNDAAIADGTFRRMPDGSPVKMCYKADGYEIGASWRSPLFMPTWASRIWLEIVSVRPKRLQAIMEEDYLKEGLKKEGVLWKCPILATMRTQVFEGYTTDGGVYFTRYNLAFKQLWDSLNAKRGYGWDTNPWVWRIEFELKRGGNDGI